MHKNSLFQRCLMVVVFLALNSSLLKGAAQSNSSISSSLASQSFSSNQFNGDLAQQNMGNTQSTKEQRDANKETRREERSLEKEAKQSCEISGDRRGGKSKKCEPSIYEQAYPGVDFQAQDEKIAEHLIRELQKDSRFKDDNIVK